MGFIIFGTVFLNLWVGNDFTDSYFVIIFIAVASLVAQTQSVAMDLVFAENEIRKTATLTFVTALIGIAIAFPLAKFFGAIGAAAGSGFGLCLYQILLNIFYRNKLELGIARFFKECHGRILPLQVLLCVLSIFLARLIGLHSWIDLIVGGAIYSIVFIIVSYLFLFNKEEKSHILLIKNVIHK